MELRIKKADRVMIKFMSKLLSGSIRVGRDCIKEGIADKAQHDVGVKLNRVFIRDLIWYSRFIKGTVKEGA